MAFFSWLSGETKVTLCCVCPQHLGMTHFFNGVNCYSCPWRRIPLNCHNPSQSDHTVILWLVIHFMWTSSPFKSFVLSLNKQQADEGVTRTWCSSVAALPHKPNSASFTHSFGTHLHRTFWYPTRCHCEFCCAGAGGSHQWGSVYRWEPDLPSRLLTFTSTMTEQNLNHFYVALLYSTEQSSPTRFITHIYISTMAQQSLDHSYITVLCSSERSGLTPIIGHIDASTTNQQRLNHSKIAVPCSTEQSCMIPFISHIHTSTKLKQSPNHFCIALLSSNKQSSMTPQEVRIVSQNPLRIRYTIKSLWRHQFVGAAAMASSCCSVCVCSMRNRLLWIFHVRLCPLCVTGRFIRVC